MSRLFEPLTQRGITLPNRIVVSPMCQYSADQGLANEWHLVHLGSRAVGGAGTLVVEATAVLPEGRISPADLGLWNDQQAEALLPINAFIFKHGAIPAVQLAHAGRKASTWRPWAPRQGVIGPQDGGWKTIAPSSIPFASGDASPQALDQPGIEGIVHAFAAAARRALSAGFKIIEIHAAHGYLLHQFLSPLSNHRQDSYGGSFENRTRLLLQVVEAVRGVLPDELPLWVRLSATDWVEGGWNLAQTIEVSRLLRGLGVDLIDVSSGGSVPDAEIPTGPGYQTGFSARVRQEAEVATGAVGLITEPAQAEHVLRTGQADLVFLGRELLRDPYWPLRAAEALADRSVAWPAQYVRAAHRDTPVR